MVAIFMTGLIGSFSVGFTLGGYNTAGIVVEAQKDWEHIYTVLITSSSVLGLMMGSLLCDKFLKYGRMKTAQLANALIIVSVVPQMWLTVPGLMFGRLLLGFGGGLSIVSTSVFMSETVPALKLGIYGTSVNTGIVTGILVTTLIQGFSMPNIDDTDKVDSTTSWRIGFLSPGLFAVVNILQWVFLIRRDSLYFLIDKNEEESALAQFQRIYKFNSDEEMREAWEETK